MIVLPVFCDENLDACARILDETQRPTNQMKKTKKPIKPSGKNHAFKLIVRSNGTRKSAYYAVLASFAKRSPDGYEFYLQGH
jgi:hypothetical protein